jgi:CDP-diacylglycerol pyrophosphatase
MSLHELDGPPPTQQAEAHMRIALQLALTLLLALAAAPAHAQNCAAANSDPGRCVLWKFVHDQCVPEQKAQEMLKLPCVKVDLAGEYVIFKDRTGPKQLLAIPTEAISGIEDPKILAPGAPNYFADAWQSHDLVSKTLSREDIGLAINSKDGRTQDQLHIHIDCLLPDVVDAVRKNAASVTDKWAPFPVNLAGQAYIARSVASADLSGFNPFDLLADGVPVAQPDMIKWTLAAVPATVAGAPGFLLLANDVPRASAEELQGDHKECGKASSN